MLYKNSLQTILLSFVVVYEKILQHNRNKKNIQQKTRRTDAILLSKGEIYFAPIRARAPTRESFAPTPNSSKQ